MDLDQATNHLYVGGSPNFLNIDAATGTIVDAFTAKSHGVVDSPPSVAVNPITNKVYVATSGVLVYDPITTTTSLIGSGTDYPYVIAVDPTTNTIYSANGTTLWVINGATNTITATIPLGAGSPFDSVQLLIDPVMNKVYVLGSYGLSPGPPQVPQTNLSVLDSSTNTLTTIAANLGQGSGNLNPVTHKLYITDQRANLIDIVTPQ
jgi:YVTN family beta-propeller protein